MRTTRLIVGTVSAGLLGLAPIAIAAPSQAADTWTTTTTASPSVAQVEYGDDFYVSVDVPSSDGSTAYRGTSTLYAMEAGTSAWVPVATNTSAAGDFYDIKPQMNTSYKVVYAGYTAATQYEDTYTPSESAPFTIGVARKITRPSSGFVIKGKVTPDYAKKKIVIQVSKKEKKGYKKFKTIKTDNKGKYKVRLPRRGGTWYWSFTVKADAKYLANGFGWRTWVS
jgi:hypothetical protein